VVQLIEPAALAGCCADAAALHNRAVFEIFEKIFERSRAANPANLQEQLAGKQG
jgi:hypothetical protein